MLQIAKTLLKKDSLADTPQVDAFFTWLSEHATADDCVYVDLPQIRGTFQYQFPHRAGAAPKLVETNRDYTFRLHTLGAVSLDEQWVCIFKSAQLEIFEHKTRYRDEPKPLRWGLSAKERNEVLQIARAAIETYLIEGRVITDAFFTEGSERLDLHAQVDVALWVDGELRGSVVEKDKLSRAVADAAIRSSRDKRFKPLVREELDRVRIQVTVMSDLKLPLTKRELEKEDIYADKGYLFTSEDNVNGWYMPAVFNCVKFDRLSEVIETLIINKAGLLSVPENPLVKIFEVDDFIELPTRAGSERLYGPVPFPLVSGGTEILNEKELEKIHHCAHWLQRIQGRDGSLPVAVDPLTGRVKQMDWARLCFTAWSLAEFGRVSEDSECVACAEKCVVYVKSYLDDRQIFNFAEGGILILVYLIFAELSLGKKSAAIEIIDRFMQVPYERAHNPLADGYILSLLVRLDSDPNIDLSLKCDIDILANRLKNQFEVELQTPHAGTVQWSEAVWALHTRDREGAQYIADWILTHQVDNGSFMTSTLELFAYTRGTGKIFEVLSYDPARYQGALKKSLAWLLSMQYTEEMLFFVPKPYQEKVRGSIRHDYLNQEAWIDAAGHLLLGTARILKAQARHASFTNSARAGLERQ